MIGIAYLVLLGSLVVWASNPRRRAWPASASRKNVLAARMSASVISGLLAALGVAVLNAYGPDNHRVTLFIGIALAGGGSLFLLGLALWRGRLGRTLRVAGWIAMVAALVVPSIGTLLLVLVAPMVFLLERIPSVSAPSEPVAA